MVSHGVMVFVYRGLKKNTDAACGAGLRSLCMVLLRGNHNQTSAHGAGRCEVGELPGLELPSSVLGGLNRYVTHLFDPIASTHPSQARSHTSGTGIHPMEKPQCRREKPRPSYSPQSGGLDETHLQLHQDRIKLQGKHDFLLHATLQVQRSRQIVTSTEGAPSRGATNACCGTSAGGVGGAPDRASCRTSYRTT